MAKQKKSDLSMYDKPFNIDEFVFSTPLTIRKIKISRNGFKPLILRYMTDATWQMENGVGIQGSRWATIDADFVENFINNLPEGDVLEELI